jgi:predicted nuclease with RNAse H fold
MDKVYIGIDPTGGRRPMNYAVLNDDLDLVARGLGKMGKVLEVVQSYASAVVAIDAPQSPNGGLMASPARRGRYGLPPKSTTWAKYKVCEYELRRRGIRLYNTPSEVEAAPKWMQLGFELYKALRADGYQLYQAGSATPKQYLEVHPHATYTVLLNRVPLRKDSLEGRMQRQLVLCREKVDVPDPMIVLEEITRHHLLEGDLVLPQLCTHDELDALSSAYTAYLAYHHPDRVTSVGDPVEGQIILPVAPADFKDTYL